MLSCLVLSLSSVLEVLYAEEQADASNDPLGCFFLGFEVEGPDIRWSALTRLVDGALVHVFHVLFIHKYSLDENHWDARGKLLQSRLLDQTGLSVPTCPLHE